MSQPFDIGEFPGLPPEVVKAFEMQCAALGSSRFEASVERAARLHEQAAVAEMTELVEKLQGQIAQYKRAKFGPKSEKLDPAQLQLALEDLETAMAETEERIAAVEAKIEAQVDPAKKAPRKPRALPENLPRVERVIGPETIAWSPLERHWSERQWRRGCGDMVRIGEDRSERIDVVPAQYRVIHCPAVHVYMHERGYHPPQIRLPQGARGRGASQGPRASAGGQLAHRSDAGAYRRGQTFGTYAAKPSGAGHGPSRLPDRPVCSCRLDGSGGRACRAGRRPDGRPAEIRDFPALRPLLSYE